MDQQETIVRITSVITKIRILIQNLETYVESNTAPEAFSTAKTINNHFDTILAILVKLQQKANGKFAHLVTQEIKTIQEIEKYVTDMPKHPEHMQIDHTKISQLEDLLEKIIQQESTVAA